MHKAYIPTLAALILLAILHSTASQLHLYVRVPWFDIMMHVLGGIGLALSIYWILITFFKNITLSFWKVVLLTVVAGIVWELWEVYYQITGAPVGTLRYYVDTSKDLLNDLLGAILVAYVIFTKK